MYVITQSIFPVALDFHCLWGPSFLIRTVGRPAGVPARATPTLNDPRRDP